MTDAPERGAPKSDGTPTPSTDAGAANASAAFKREMLGYIVAPALKRAAEQLAEANTAMAAGAGRQGVILALHAACEFFETFGDLEASVRPLRGLAFALSDLDVGKTATLLEPLRDSHRPTTEVSQQMIAFAAAGAMEHLMRCGFSMGEAAARAARICDANGLRASSGAPVEAVTVKNWRSRLNQGPRDEADWAWAHPRWKPLQAVVKGTDQPSADEAESFVLRIRNLLSDMGILDNPPA